MIGITKASTPSHFSDASRLIDAYQRYIIEQNLTMCLLGALDDEIMMPESFYDPTKGGIFLAYGARDTESPSTEHQSLGTALGIACMEEHQPIQPDIRCAEIRRMYVTPEARGQKVGEALIEACVSEAQKLGYKRVVLDTFQDPTYALKLYKRMGFTECAPFNHLPLDKAVWLEKFL